MEKNKVYLSWKWVDDQLNNIGDRFVLPGETQPKSIIERYGEETDLDDLKYYADILKQQNENPKQFKKTFAPFHSFIDETKNLISTEVIKILDPTSYNNDLKRFRDDMYSLYIKGISEGKSPLELLKATPLFVLPLSLIKASPLAFSTCKS